MKNFTISAFGETHQVYINLGKYANGRVSISLMDASDHLPYATASVNLPEVFLEEGEVCIKDYSENEGMFDFLIQNNIISDTGKYVRSGFTVIPIAKLKPELSWGTSNQLDPIPAEINTETGKSMWIINGYRIWSDTYQNALQHMQLIESF